jgi:hypothetical protein
MGDVAVEERIKEYVQPEKDNKLAELVVKRQGRLEEDRGTTDILWDDVDTIISPRRAVYDLGYRKGKRPGDRLGEEIFDGTPSSSGQDLGDGFQSQSADSKLDWWRASQRNPQAKKDFRAKQWFDIVHEIVTLEMAQSDFYKQYNEACHDGVFNGIAHMSRPIWLPSRGRLSYRTFSPREIFIARDYNDDIDLWHHKFPITNRQLAREFGVEKLDLKMRKSVETNPYETHMIIHAIQPNDERDTSKYTSENKKVLSLYILEDKKLILRKGGFDDWPMYTWCWRRDSNGAYGRGPAIDTIWDALTTNKAYKNILHSAQLWAMQPLIANEELKGKIKITPHGITWRENDSQKVEPLLQSQGNYPIAMDAIMKLREELRDKFKARTFQLLSYLTAETSRMNMMQISEIQGEKAALLIPLTTRNESELLAPMLNATFQVLAENERIPRPPDSVMQYMSSPVDIEFIGPIAVAAKRYLQNRGINLAMSRMIGDAPLLQVWPEMKDKIKPEDLFDYLWDADGAPTKLVQDPKVYLQIRTAAIKAQQQMQKAAMAEKIAQNYPSLTKAPEEGSPAAEMGK